MSCVPFSSPVPAPASLTAPCPPLVKLDEPATLGTLFAAVAENYGLYHECAARHAALAAWGRP